MRSIQASGHASPQLWSFPRATERSALTAMIDASPGVSQELLTGEKTNSSITGESALHHHHDIFGITRLVFHDVHTSLPLGVCVGPTG